jgi:replicative DNA helicase
MDKVYPHSVEAEMSVLGTILMNPDVFETIYEILKPDYFYVNAHKTIFEVIAKLRDKKKNIDLVILSEELKAINKLEEIGGMEYLYELVEKVSSPAHSKEYAEIVKEKYILRELIKVSTKIMEDAYNSSDTLDKIIDNAQKSIFDVSQKNLTHSFLPPKQLVMSYLNVLQNAKKEGKMLIGVPSGFTRLDLLTGGFKDSEFIIIAARPSQGKTAFALNIAYHVAIVEKIPVIFFSLEMDSYSLINRIIAYATKLNAFEIRRGKFRNEDWQYITTIVSKIYETNTLWIDDTPGMTIMDIRSRARKLILDLQSKNPSLNKFLIIIDYLQLIRGVGRFESRQQEVSEISRLLKDMARSLNVPVIALSQLNRRVEDRTKDGSRPQLSDLRESGSLEQDADIVIMIHRDKDKKENPNDNTVDIIVAKNRNGPVDTVQLMFFPEYTRFSEPLPPTEKTLDEEIPL